MALHVDLEIKSSTKQSAGITNQQLDQELFSCSFFLSVQSYRLFSSVKICDIVQSYFKQVS